MLAVIYAVLAAASNAVGAVCQRRAALQAPPETTLRLSLILDLLKRPIWLAGFAALIMGFILQASALSVGDLTLVQPIVTAELPLTLVIAAAVFRAPLDRDAWIGVIAVSIGLAVVLFSMNPSGGDGLPDNWAWLWVSVASVGAGVVLISTGLKTAGGPRASLFGAAAGLGFGFTAALMKGSLERIDEEGVGRVFGHWQLYGMMLMGVASFFMIQNALQAGSLVAAQPPISVCDPLVSIAYGVLLFGEDLRTGVWLAPALLGALIIAFGTVALSRSPLARAENDQLGQLDRHNPAITGEIGTQP